MGFCVPFPKSMKDTCELKLMDKMKSFASKIWENRGGKWPVQVLQNFQNIYLRWINSQVQKYMYKVVLWFFLSWYILPVKNYAAQLVLEALRLVITRVWAVWVSIYVCTLFQFFGSWFRFSMYNHIKYLKSEGVKDCWLFDKNSKYLYTYLKSTGLFWTWLCWHVCLSVWLLPSSVNGSLLETF